MSTNYETILFESDNNIGVITLNREAKLNALNSQVMKDLTSLLSELKENKESLRGLIFTGAGEKSFIAGADISEMSGLDSAAGCEFARLGQKVTLLFESLPFPVIAAVNGFALGGGLEMALACDFIYATNNSIFGQPEVKLGLIPGFGGTQRLAKIIGRNKAKELIYSGRNVDINEAKSCGLVLSSFGTKDELIKYAKEVLMKMSFNSSNAIKQAKMVMNQGNDLTITEGLECEAKTFGSIFGHPEMIEGTNAFVEKRKPKF